MVSFIMKKLLGIVVLGLLVGCADGYQSFQKKNIKQYKFFVKVKSPTRGITYYAASNSSYDAALETAKGGCKSESVYDCIAYSLGNRYVYNPPAPPSREDRMIAKARDVCKKIGVTPGTDKFIDCTIKMMSTSSGQQTVIVGQRKRTSIYPLHCRQMGGMSNC